MKIITQYILLLIVMSVFSEIKAQEPLLFDKITDKSGRSLGFITGIEQDNDGFMWFATRNGLYRYDGYNYKLYKNEKGDSTSLPFSNFTNLYYDKSGVLWLNHLDKYVAFKNEKVDPNYNYITDSIFDLDTKIIDDGNNNLWIGQAQRGIYKYNKTNSKISVFNKPKPQYSPETYVYIDSLCAISEGICTITNITNNANLTKEFNITEPTDILIITVGEADRFRTFDYGFISSNSEDIVWKMDFQKTKLAGGIDKNRVQIALITLKPGIYNLHYKADELNSPEKWVTAKPDKTSFYGIKILKAPSNINKLSLLAGYIPQNAISSDNVRSIFVDNNKNICILTSEGIDIFDKENNSFTAIPIDFAKILGDKNQISTAYLDNKNILWVGTEYSGLLKYNINNQKYKLYQNKIDTNSITNNYVRSILKDRNGRLWIGTANGLNLFDRETEVFYNYKSDNNNRLYGNQIFKIYEDRSGNIWIGTSTGLNKQIKSKFQYQNLGLNRYTDYKYEIDKNDIFWHRGVSNSLSAFDIKNNTRKKYLIDEKYFRLDEITQDRVLMFNGLCNVNDNIYVAIDNAMYKFIDTTKQFEICTKLSKIKTSEENIINPISDLLKDKNSIYIFSPEILYKYDTETRQLTDSLKLSLTKNEQFNEGFKYIISTYLDSRNKIWMRAYNGLYKIDITQKKIEKVVEFAEEIIETDLTEGNIFEDKKGNIWMAILPNLYKFKNGGSKSQIFVAKDCGDIGHCNVFEDNNAKIWIYSDNGLYKQEEDNIFTQYSVSDGLLDKTISGTVDDLRGNLWICTAKGLSKFNENNKTIENYFTSRDFSSHKFIGANDKKRKESGEIIFFTNDGFLSYYPDSINQIKPKIAITRFWLLNEENNLKSLLNENNELILKYNQNFISFEFSSLDYTDPTQNRYYYTLEGLDEDTIFSDANNRIAKYTSMPHGEYVFRLKGSNSDGIWSDELSITIIINPPFWKTAWFRILSVIFIVFLLFLIIRIRERNLKNEKRILEQKVKERTAEIEEKKHQIELQRDQIQTQKDQVTEHRDQIATQKQEITDSIQYASRIQTALLPSEKIISNNLSDHFILYKPKDIVSGDYYWMKEKDRKIIITAADCTGHGVPGAFLSMLGVSFLNEITTKKQISSAGAILDELREYVMSSLNQTGKDGEAKDGMDIALCVIDLEKNELQFSGAYNPLYIVRKNKEGRYDLTQIKADRMPIGIYFAPTDHFSNHKLDLQKGDTLYIFSDGYADQFGGKYGRKFMGKRFRELLIKIQENTMTEQKTILNDAIEQWKSPEYEQIDDMLVIGIRI